MATSGSLTTTAYSSRSLTFSWSEKSQSVADNTTTISWSIKGSGSASGYYKCQNITLKLDGKAVFQHKKDSDGQINLYNGTSVASGTYTFTHGSDGKKQFTAYLEAGIYEWAPNCSGTKTFTLDDIPRQATVSSAQNFTDEENPTMTYSNPAGSAVTSLQACIADTSGAVIIAYRDISKTGTSYTFNFTDAERTTLRTKCNSANSMNVRFYVKTEIGSNTFRSYTGKTLSIVNATPTLSATVEDVDTATIALTGDKTKLIKYFSDAAVKIGAAALKNATISSKSCVHNGNTVTADGTFYDVSNNSFKFSATDSRGNTVTKTLTPTMINYVKLTCNIDDIGVTTDGVMNFSLKGNYFNGSFGATSNTLTVQYRYKTSGGSYSSWASVTATKSGNTYTASGSVSGLDYKTKYVFQARAVDKIYDGTYQSRVTTAEKAVSAQPVFDWSEDDFNLNVNGTYTDSTGTYSFAQIGKAMMNATSLSCSVTKGANYSSASGSAYLVGNTMRIYFTATRSSQIAAGNNDNETICSFSIDTGGKVIGTYTVYGICANNNSCFYLGSAAASNGVITFDIMLSSVGIAATTFTSYFAAPCRIDISKF